MDLFDSHAHYDDERFDEDRDTLLSSLPQNGVGTVVNCASDMGSCETSLDLAQKYPFIYAAVGVHPHEAKSFTDADLARLKEYAGEEKAVAIGEIGLDYYYHPEDKTVQQAVFQKQLALAKELGLPAVIHCRDADGDCFDIVKNSGTTGVYHCYGGSVELMRELVKLGYYISFGGVVTFKNARRVLEVVKEVPEDRLLIETDCPYLAPEPMRGRRNSSLFLRYTCEKIAQVRGISPETLADITKANAKRVFKI